MQRAAPVHPSKLTGAARAQHVAEARKAKSLDALREAKVGAKLLLSCDYGEAYALITTGRTPRRAQHFAKLVEITFVLERLETSGKDRRLLGTASWPGFAAPAEIRLTHDGKQRSILLGNEDDRGGLFEGWFVGCVGDLLSACDRPDTI